MGSGYTRGSDAGMEKYRLGGGSRCAVAELLDLTSVEWRLARGSASTAELEGSGSTDEAEESEHLSSFKCTYASLASKGSRVPTRSLSTVMLAKNSSRGVRRLNKM